MTLFSVQRCKPPAHALHLRYVAQGAYLDCYTTVVRGAVSLVQFVEAFYTTLLFKLERLILFLLLKPSTDSDARRLAHGESNAFAAWTVEARTEDQLLMRDFLGRTRSWFMIALEDWDGDIVTRLYFGSVVVASVNKRTGKRELGLPALASLPIHKLYSRVLLGAARMRIKRAKL